MEHLLAAAAKHVLDAAAQSGGLFLLFGVAQVLFIILFIRLSRIVTSLSHSVGDLAGNIANLATEDDLKNLEAHFEAGLEKQAKVDETLHDRCTALVNRVARVEGICDTCRRK